MRERPRVRAYCGDFPWCSEGELGRQEVGRTALGQAFGSVLCWRVPAGCLQSKWAWCRLQVLGLHSPLPTSFCDCVGQTCQLPRVQCRGEAAPTRRTVPPRNGVPEGGGPFVEGLILAPLSMIRLQLALPETSIAAPTPTAQWVCAAACPVHCPPWVGPSDRVEPCGGSCQWCLVPPALRAWG